MSVPTLFVANTAGLLVGAITGAFLVTEAEAERRRKHFQFTGPHVARLIILWLLICAGCVATGIIVLSVGNAHPLSRQDRYALGGSILAGAAIAKTCRYLYWKRPKWP
jgi:hypothetical protein